MTEDLYGYGWVEVRNGVKVGVIIAPNVEFDPEDVRLALGAKLAAMTALNERTGAWPTSPAVLDA